MGKGHETTFEKLLSWQLQNIRLGAQSSDETSPKQAKV
jgi:hypothetical protein